MQKQYTVLIIDDKDESREGYKLTFEANNFIVLEANDGVPGLAIAIEKKPDLILTGIMMPRMHGFEMIKQLQARPDTAKIPVMIISHRGLATDKAESEKLGIKDFLIQGFVTPKELIWRAMLRIEGNVHKTYLIGVDEKTGDAPNLITDFKFPEQLHCTKHYGEKMVLSMNENPDKPGEFLAKFVCVQDASQTFKKADI